MADGSVFGLAGIYERWLSEGGDVIDSCAIVTTEANADVADLIAPYPPEAMAYYPVSSRVNAVRNDDASLIEPITQAERDPAESEPPPHPPEQESLF
jgi:putative SOS response-associated peptidase YedK